MIRNTKKLRKTGQRGSESWYFVVATATSFVATRKKRSGSAVAANWKTYRVEVFSTLEKCNFKIPKY